MFVGIWVWSSQNWSVCGRNSRSQFLRTGVETKLQAVHS